MHQSHVRLIMKRFTVIIGAVLSLVVLMSAMKIATVKVDLTSKGIPVTIDAPNGCMVESGLLNGMVMDEVTTYCWDINNGDFSLEVMMDDEDLWQARREYVEYAKNVLEMDESFMGYIEADENGFLAKMDYSGEIEYEFYHLVVKNNRAIEFSTGMATSNYSLENIREIYHAAKTAK